MQNLGSARRDAVALIAAPCKQQNLLMVEWLNAEISVAVAFNQQVPLY
jgi:hypothetical protein